MPNFSISDLPPATLPLDLPNTFFELQTIEGGVEVSRKLTATDLGVVGGITIQEEGVPLPTLATTLDFVGAQVTASGAGATKTITVVPGGIVVEDEGVPLVTAAGILNFVGAGVVASGGGATKTITIPGSSGAQISGVPVNNQLAVWVNATDIEGDANLTYDGVRLTLGFGAAQGEIMLDADATAARGSIFTKTVGLVDTKILTRGSSVDQLNFGAAAFALDIRGSLARFNQSIFILEQAAAQGSVAGQGQLWVRNDTPNVLVFTDDAGTDTVLGSGGGGSPGGVNEDIQFNNAGAFGGTSEFTWDGATMQIAVDDAEIVIDDVNGFGEPLLRLTSTGGAAGGARVFLDVTTGRMALQQTATGGTAQDLWVNMQRNGAVQLYFNNVQQFATSADGITLPNTGGQSIFITEKAAAAGSVAASGQLWVRNDVPNVLVFTDDAGTDTVLGGAGGGAQISGVPLNNQIAVWVNGTDIEGDANFTWDGSSLAIASNIATPLTLTGTINSSYSLNIDNNSNGTANAARASISSGDGNVALFVAGTGRTSTVITGGPTGRQTVLRTLDATHPLLFGTSNTLRMTIDNALISTEVNMQVGATGDGNIALGGLSNSVDIRITGMDENDDGMVFADGMPITFEDIAQANDVSLKNEGVGGGSGTLTLRTTSSANFVLAGPGLQFNNSALTEPVTLIVIPTTVRRLNVNQAMRNQVGHYITERAAASADFAGDGQLWVRNDTPNVLMFTDDAGTDHQISP